MPQTAKKQNHRPLLAALVTLVVLLAATAAIWLAVVRPQLGKGRTETLCDDFNQSELLHPGDVVRVMVLEVDVARKRISLTMKGLPKETV